MENGRLGENGKRLGEHKILSYHNQLSHLGWTILLVGEGRK